MTYEHTWAKMPFEMLETNAVRHLAMNHVAAPDLQSMISLLTGIGSRANPAPIIQLSNAIEQHLDHNFSNG
jgi:hypothetical protein